MSTAAIIQPINDNNDPHKILTLLDGSSISDERQEEEEVDELQKQHILSYIKNESSNTSSTYLSPKRVPRLGPYLLLKTLGVGEFGKVKMGRHIETGQTVAVKLVKKENIDSSSQLDKIRMEIDILKTLNHPYIVKLLSVNETNTCIGMVLEFAKGGELFEYIYRQRYLKENEAKRLFSQLISCVYYMHQKNIVHRDLKLENILLDHRGNLIVTDFGFANQFTPITGDLMSTSCGSPVYAAPELVMTGRLYSGTGVDIWSCGIILYAMLCGYLPFDDDVKNPNGDNIGRLYRYIMANKPKYPSHLSHDSKDVIGKMLMPDPSARCKIEAIMIHPWLHQYKDQMSKSIEELESEALELKQSLMQGIEILNTQNDGDYVEEVCCDEDQIDEEEEDENNSCCSNDVCADNTSVCSSVSSSYSYGNNVDSIKEEIEKEQHLENGNTSPPTTPIPHAKEVSMTTDKLSRKSSHASQQQSLDTAAKSTTNMSLEHGDTSAIIPVSVPENNDKQVKKEPSIINTKNEFTTTTTNSASSSSAHSSSISTPPSPVIATTTVINKRHTIDTTTFNTHQQQEEEHQSRPVMPVQHSSLRAKLFSSVKRRNNHSSKKINSNNQTVVDGQGHDTKKSHNKRHSWQNIIHRHHHNSNNNLPLSPPSSPTLPEQSKSVRLLSWLKNKSPSTSSHHLSKKNKNNNFNTSTERRTANHGESTSSSSNSSSNNSISREEDATIPIAKPSSSSLAHMHGSSNTPSRAPTVLSLMQQQQYSNSHRDHNIIDEEQISVESELRVHTGDMNRSALTSKPPMEVLLEINKILLILGIEVENKGGYKLHCIRRATSHYHGEALLDDRMNHLATSHQPGLSLPIYGHPSIDTGEEVLFSVEICRFENLSGLFSVDIQCLSSEKEESFAAYQFIGQKLLALLHLGNAIRNTNFNVMLSSSSSHTS